MFNFAKKLFKIIVNTLIRSFYVLAGGTKIPPAQLS
jgi:hypothetical protein